MTDEISELLNNEVEKHQDVKDRIRKLERFENKRHNEKLEEIYDKSVLSDFQQDVIRQREKYNSICSDLDDLRVFVSDVILGLLNKNYSGSRFVIDERFTIRDDDIYKYNDSNLASLSYIISYSDGIKEKFEDKLDSNQQQKLDSLFNNLEVVLADLSENILGRRNPVIYEKCDINNYDYVFYTVNEGCFGLSNSQPSFTGDIPKFSEELIVYNSTKLTKDKLKIVRNNKDIINKYIDMMDNKLDGLSSDLEEFNAKEFSSIVISDELAD
jgi:hypothetical protein